MSAQQQHFAKQKSNVKIENSLKTKLLKLTFLINEKTYTLETF